MTDLLPMTELLPSLLKAGGIASLSIGVVYLIYREIIKLGVVPKLKQWQGFALLCLLAVLVFVIAITVLLRESDTPKLEGELPPINHFQLDSKYGIFCEKKNVYKPFSPFFDSVDINISACNSSNQSGSRTYRIDWQPLNPRPVTFSERRGYDHCFVSDFSERAPQFIQNLDLAFKRSIEAIPCKVTLYMSRQIRMSYTDLHNQPIEVAFIQTYNMGDTKQFEIEQVGTAKLPRSDEMESVTQEPDGSVVLDRLLEISAQYGYPGVPKQ